MPPPAGRPAGGGGDDLLEVGPQGGAREDGRDVGQEVDDREGGRLADAQDPPGVIRDLDGEPHGEPGGLALVGVEQEDRNDEGPGAGEVLGVRTRLRDDGGDLDGEGLRRPVLRKQKDEEAD